MGNRDPTWRIGRLPPGSSGERASQSQSFPDATRRSALGKCLLVRVIKDDYRDRGTCLGRGEQQIVGTGGDDAGDVVEFEDLGGDGHTVTVGGARALVD